MQSDDTSVTERYGQILGEISTYQNRENIDMDMLTCPETFILWVVAERTHDSAPAHFSRAVREMHLSWPMDR
jgi:hypothetical protein